MGGLEIKDGLHDIDDVHGIPDYIDDSLQIAAPEPANIPGSVQLLRLEFTLQYFESRLNLAAPARLLAGPNDFLTLLEIRFLPHVQVNGQLLVNLRHLFAQIPAAGMDHQIKAPSEALSISMF